MIISDQEPNIVPFFLAVERGYVFQDTGDIRNIHFPGNADELESARRRLAYDEIFYIQMLMALRRESRGEQAAVALEKPGDLTARLVGDLPFDLTGAQRRVLSEILADLRSGRPMHRLLQGDVGSGKTLVALIAALFVIEQGYQALLMAPTEVLAAFDDCVGSMRNRIRQTIAEIARANKYCTPSKIRVYYMPLPEIQR